MATTRYHVFVDTGNPATPGKLAPPAKKNNRLDELINIPVELLDVNIIFC